MESSEGNRTDPAGDEEQNADQGPIDRLGLILTEVPGIGPKAAQRCALHIARLQADRATEIAEILTTARASTQLCRTCRNLTDGETCRICRTPGRRRTLVCVVESTRDVVAIERTQTYVGTYHVLHGVLAPAKGVGPEEIELGSLFQRVQDEQVEEVIVATNTSMEGDATADFIRRRLETTAPEVRVTRIARGLPRGAELTFSDAVTLRSALQGRTEQN